MKGGKYILVGAMMGTEVEVTSHLINGPRLEVSGEGEYIVVNNYSPSLVKVDNVESTHNTSGTWIPGIWNPVTICIFFMVLVILIWGPLRWILHKIFPKVGMFGICLPCFSPPSNKNHVKPKPAISHK